MLQKDLAHVGSAKEGPQSLSIDCSTVEETAQAFDDLAVAARAVYEAMKDFGKKKEGKID